MISEVEINRLSQLVYLDCVPQLREGGGTPTVGQLADYYTADSRGALYLKVRFGEIEREYRSWLRFLQEDLASLRHWKIKNVLNDNGSRQSGFYGCTFCGDEQQVVAFRGSELLGNSRYKNDYKTNLALSYADQTPQQKVVDRYFLLFDELARAPFLLTGHSLGGNLAAYGAVCAPARVKAQLQGCYTFNGPGFSREFLERRSELVAAAAPSLFLYQNKGDLVSSLLYPPANPIVICSGYDPQEEGDFSALNVLYPHSNFVFSKEDDHTFLRCPTAEKTQLCGVVQELSQGFLRLPTSAKKAICALVLEGLYAKPSPEKRTQAVLERITKLMIYQRVPDGEEGGLDLFSAAFAARQLVEGEESLEVAYRRASEGAADTAGKGRVLLLLFAMLQEFVLQGDTAHDRSTV